MVLRLLLSRKLSSQQDDKYTLTNIFWQLEYPNMKHFKFFYFVLFLKRDLRDSYNQKVLINNKIKQLQKCF